MLLNGNIATKKSLNKQGRKLSLAIFRGMMGMKKIEIKFTTFLQMFEGDDGFDNLTKLLRSQTF